MIPHKSTSVTRQALNLSQEGKLRHFRGLVMAILANASDVDETANQLRADVRTLQGRVLSRLNPNGEDHDRSAR